MIELSYAKINLCLNIKRRREDGYHELESIFLPVALSDILFIEPTNEASSLTCTNDDIPLDDRNLILKAIRLFKETYQREENFRVHLVKRIPAEAGLGGGSSNAAAMLRVMNNILQMNLSLEELAKLGVQLGADVPFFMYQEPAYVSGIGEYIERVRFPMRFRILLVKPPFGISTKQAYQTLNLMNAEHCDCKDIFHKIEQDLYDETMTAIANSLEESAIRLQPEIQTIKEELLALGFDCALMSGSGSSVFAITKNVAILNKGHEFYKKKNYFAEKTLVKY